ncbi:MAG TPA: glycosyltransferase, partial [Phycisphaerae bacterium]|nr:glycosyltransferase [Phycisphaerae bacterium]
LITDLEVGGVPLHLYRLAIGLPRDRFAIRVISLADPGPVGRMLREAGLTVETCNAGSAWDVRALWRLWRLLRSDRPDILHALLFHANMAARLVGPAAGIPPGRILCEIQTAEVERPWHLRLDNLTCRWCRCEIGNSPSVVEHLHRKAHIPRSRLRCEWGAVDVAAFAAAEPLARSDLGWPPEGPVLIWTGRLDPVKGFEEMLEAFALVVERVPATLVLVGEGAYRPTVERLIRDRRLDKQVLLMGRRQDVAGLLRSADLFLFCSRTEGLPNALLEAMAAGLPIVATDVPGCRDLIQDGLTGYVAVSGSASGIATKILAVLDQPSAARRLGTAARKWVRSHLDIARLVDRWSGYYDDIPG